MDAKASMGLASELFTDIVMEQAIKDKTAMVEQQMAEGEHPISAYTID